MKKLELKGLEKIDAVLTWVEERILVFSILFMAVILIANVISRNFFNSSINASEEISQLGVRTKSWTLFQRREDVHVLKGKKIESSRALYKIR